MPLYDDHFAGHLEHLDPRTPLHGASGCVWPTIPAMRYVLTSDDATGFFLPFNVFNALVIRPTIAVDHDLFAYQAVAWPVPFVMDYCRKVKDSATGGYRWQIRFTALSGPCVVEIDEAFPEQKCNVTVPLGAYGCIGGVPAGSTGDTFRMEQVEYDESSPP